MAVRVRIKRPMSIENFMHTALDPRNKTILDPYSFFVTDLPYYLRNSVGFTRRISRSTAGAPDLISWVEYGSHDLWWTLLIANRMEVGEKDIEPGMLFFIPQGNDVTSFVVQLTQRKLGERVVSLAPI